MNKGRVVTGGTAVIVAAIVISLLYFYTQGAGGTTYVPIGITDPPQVPTGTQALYINYSSVSVHVDGNGNSEWIPINSSGRLDLMGLVNESQIVGGVNIPSNSIIDLMRLNITSASIVINNVTYNVQLTNKQVTAKVDTYKTLNSSSGILVDFSPIVTETYMQNSTGFVMVPSLKAEIIPRSGLGPQQVSGNYVSIGRYPLDSKYCRNLSGLDDNLTLSNSTLSSSANTISFATTVHNSGDENVTVLGIIINGNRGSFMIANRTSSDGNITIIGEGPMPAGQTYIHKTFKQNGQGQSPPSGYGARQTKFRFYEQNGSNVTINDSALSSIGTYTGNGSIMIRLRNSTNTIYISYLNHDDDHAFGPGPVQIGGFGMGLGFIVNANGTLSLPMPRILEPDQVMQPGYSLGAQDTKTFTYGATQYHGDFGPIMGLSNQSRYTVMIVTNYGIEQANLTLT